MKNFLALAITLVLPLSLAAYGSNNNVTTNRTLQEEQSARPSVCTQAATKVADGRSNDQKAAGKKIRITVGDTVFTATLIDSQTTRDFISLLPLTLTLKDYAGTEKISDLPKKLSTEGAPSGSDPSVGDITYYAPWGNLAIFYRDFGYASGLVILGKIDSGIETFTVPGSVKVTIELIK
jgi:hypothetical protein